LFYDFGNEKRERTVEWLARFAGAIKRTILGVGKGRDRKNLRALHLHVRQLAVDSLDDFTRGYIKCALLIEEDNNGRSFYDNYDIIDIHVAALQDAVDDCKRFQAENAKELRIVYTHYTASDETPQYQAGYDLWLSRNAYSAGFWSGGLPEKAGKALADAASNLGPRDLYLCDNGWLYI